MIRANPAHVAAAACRDRLVDLADGGRSREKGGRAGLSARLLQRVDLHTRGGRPDRPMPKKVQSCDKKFDLR